MQKYLKWKRLSVDRPSRGVPSLSVFLNKSRQRMSRCRAVTSRDVMTLLHMTSYYLTKWTCTDQPISKSENHVFQTSDLDLWPMTLTFELIWDIVKVNPSTKFGIRTFNGSAGRALTDRQTHTQTGPIPYPRSLTREGITILLRSAVGITHVLRSGLVMGYTTSCFPLIVLGYQSDSNQSYGPLSDTL